MTIPFPLPQTNPFSSFTAETLLRLVLYLKCSSTNTSPTVHYVTVLGLNTQVDGTLFVTAAPAL